MIVAAAVCPSPPLLARELTGRALVLPELRQACAGVAPAAYGGAHPVPAPGDGAGGGLAPPLTVSDVPMYQVDALVRRAPSLQRTRDGRAPLATY